MFYKTYRMYQNSLLVGRWPASLGAPAVLASLAVLGPPCLPAAPYDSKVERRQVLPSSPSPRPGQCPPSCPGVRVDPGPPGPPSSTEAEETL